MLDLLGRRHKEAKRSVCLNRLASILSFFVNASPLRSSLVKATLYLGDMMAGWRSNVPDETEGNAEKKSGVGRGDALREEAATVEMLFSSQLFFCKTAEPFFSAYVEGMRKIAARAVYLITCESISRIH